MKKQKVDPAVSEYYRQMGIASARARAKKIIEKAKKAKEINASKAPKVIPS